MSSKARKRPSPSSTEPAKNSTPVKKPRKSSNKENRKNEISDVKSSEDDSGFPSCSSSFSEPKSSPIKSKSTPKKIPKRRIKNKISEATESQDVNEMDIASLLALGEGSVNESNEVNMSADSFGSSESEADDWEEVEAKEEVKEPVIPKEGVDITLEVPNIHVKRKKKGFDMEAHVKRELNKVKREMQLMMHKVHVLCWIAHIKFVNQVLNSQLLMGTSLSLITSKNLYPPKYADLTYLERIVKWYSKTIELKENENDKNCKEDLSEQLCYQFEHKVAYSKKHLVFLFVVMMRTLGLKTRIVMSFQVVPVRPSNSDLGDVKVKKESENKKQKIETKKKEKVEKESEYFKNAPEEAASTSKEKSDDKEKKKVVKRMSKKVSVSMPKVQEKKESLKPSTPKKEIKLSDSDSDESFSKHFKSSPMKLAKLKKETDEEKIKKLGESSEYFSSKKTDKKTSDKGDAKNKTKTKRSNKKPNLKTPENSKPVKKIKSGDSSDADSDFTPQSLQKNAAKKEIDRRVLSSDEEAPVKKRQGVDVWVEIFLESEEKWISVDVPRQRIHCVNELFTRATQPVVYIIACNVDGTLKDVTKRYVPNWHSETRKRRVDEEWWNETMWPYLPPKTAQDKEEDEDINQQLQDKPLPSIVSEYKNHPLYALKRHLLKFEGIYPPNAPTLGFVRGEPVYARECVVTLRSREIWFKEARVVRLGEEPYKIVKSRPKYDKMTGEVKKDLPLELFGIWQTEEYIPPIAVDGKVPRNEYGNVDLFKPCMLPKGTVHLPIPGLIRVAKKLGIDCAPAIVGFEFHSGGCHPVNDGFVICEEFKEQLLDAWNKEIDESAKRNEEKREKRIYGNWKRLIRGLLIREKLKLRYAFGENSDDESQTQSQSQSQTYSKPKAGTSKCHKNSKK